ncbi:MAG: SLBB domain-containing protein [Chlamydiia bacterium]|nr:SLBB domain-containing protein [Chlamydiia bacterium]
MPDSDVKHSEWVLAVSFSLFLFTLILISQLHDSAKSSKLQKIYRDRSRLANTSCTVTVSGAVEHPGSYVVPIGAPIAYILKKTRPTRFANLRDLVKDQEIRGDCSLHIEELSTIFVSVEGAVLEPCTLELPIKTRICQLKTKIRSAPHANLDFFKKRRLLKDGERVHIPSLSEEEMTKCLHLNSDLFYDSQPVTSF